MSDEITCAKCEKSFEIDETDTAKCGHSFCLLCLSAYLKSDENLTQICPVEGCSEVLPEGIIETILDDYYMNQYKKKSIAKCLGAKLCLLPECDNVIILNDKDVTYECSKCTVFICVLCNVAHRNLDCDQYNIVISPDLNSTVNEDPSIAELNRAQAVLDETRKLEISISLEEVDLWSIIPNDQPFKCVFCFKLIRKRCGMALRNCYHYCCLECFKEYIKSQSSHPIKCPSESCTLNIDDRDIRALLNQEECNQLDRQTVKEAIAEADDCRNAECTYVIVLDNVNKISEWKCKLCGEVNCLKCNAIHTGTSCQEFKCNNPEIFEQRKKLEQSQDIMSCLTCHRWLSKSSGCDYIKCPHCGADLCWITRKYRYGPNGCGCRKFKRCHPKCKGCNPHRCSIM